MTLDQLYQLHDDFEVMLRKLERMGLLNHRLGAAVWSGHDILERIILVNQARLTEEQLDNEAEVEQLTVIEST